MQKIIPLLILMLATGCSALLPKPPINTAYYSLGSTQVKTQASKAVNTNSNLPTLIVNTPKAAAGFDTRHMMYTRAANQLEYFARNEWVDTPSNMLQPLMVAAIEQTQGFNAVLPKLAAVKADLRLESEIIKLVQDFNTKPSQIQLTIRATLIDIATNKVIALREFDEIILSASDNPKGGVIAANMAVSNVLIKLSEFVHLTTLNWLKTRQVIDNK